MFGLAEKVDGAVSVKYQLPGEDLDPDALITVADDSDVQVPPAALPPPAAQRRAAFLPTAARRSLSGRT
jgi:hypothetical protein